MFLKVNLYYENIMKISFINAIALKYDAISTSLREQVNWCIEAGHEVAFFAEACDFSALPFIAVKSMEEIACHPFYRSSQVLVFHFGVYYPFFDLLLEPRSDAKRLVFFHNVTPRQYVAEASRQFIDKSFAQIGNINYADEVVCVSETNRKVLESVGTKIPMSILPLPVASLRETGKRKPSIDDQTVRLVFIGRFVMSKGPCDLLEALSCIAKENPNWNISLDMIGNIGFSSKQLLAEIDSRIKKLHAEFKNIQVSIRGDLDDSRKNKILEDADIFVLPTYHEGFCVPVLEALAKGCRVISYDNSNLPAISGGLGTLVATGDIKKLAAAMEREINLVLSADWQKDGFFRYFCKSLKHLELFNPDVIRQCFLAKIEKIISSK